MESFNCEFDHCRCPSPLHFEPNFLNRKACVPCQEFDTTCIKDCQAGSNCATCAAASSANCTGCFLPRVLEGTTCVCPKGFYEDSVDLKCKRCDETCAECSDKGPDKCTACKGVRTKVDPPAGADDGDPSTFFCDCSATSFYSIFSDDCVSLSSSTCEGHYLTSAGK